MARGRGDMREVDLVEVVDDADPVTGDPSVAHRRPGLLTPSRWSPAARSRARGAVLVAVAVLVAATVASTVLSQRREEARLRALADVPGVLAPLAGPPQRLWGSDQWAAAGFDEVDGRLVTVLSTPTDGYQAVAYDSATGEVAWRTPVPSDAPATGWTDCDLPGAPWPDVPDDVTPDDSPVLVCVVVDELATTQGRARDRYTYPVRTRLVTVDAVTGELVDDRPVTSPASLATVDADLLLGTVDGRGHAHVTRIDPRTRTEHWAFTTPEPVPADASGQRPIVLRTDGDLIVADAGPVWALSGTGEVLLELSADGAPYERHLTQPIAGGRLLARSASDTDALVTDLVDVATGRTTAIPGYVIVPFPDDRSLPDLVLAGPATGSGLVAHDVTSGEVRWSVGEGHGSGRPMVLDGRIIGIDGSRVEALDGATGQVVWSTAVPGASPPGPLLTDGRVVITATTTGTDAALVALDLRDGRQVWSTGTDGPLHVVDQAGDRLLGYGPTGLVVLGAAPPGD